MKHFFYLILPAILLYQCRYKEEKYTSIFPGKPEVPSVIKQEHQYLLNKLHDFTLFQDSTGHTALKLNDLIQHHFMEEEDYVLPPLGLLPLLASQKMPEHTEEIILLTEKLKSQLSHLSAEHQLIKAFLNELVQAARYDHHPEIIEFEKEVQKHAMTEEEIYFPLAILIGEYLKLNQ